MAVLKSFPKKALPAPTNAGDLRPLLEEIRNRCALILSEDFATHSAAYLWLRDCRPFRRVLERFREHQLNLYDVAAILAPGSNRPLASAALKMLAEEVVAANG